MSATWAKAQPLRDVARRFEDRKRRERGSFRKTITFNEQQIMRKIIRHSDRVKMKKSERAGLLMMANLWFYHRDKGAFAPGNNALMKKLRVTKNTLRSVVRFMERNGFIISRGGGRGHADRKAYVVDLGKIAETLAPDLTIYTEAEAVNIDGQIEENLGVKNRGSLYSNSDRLSKSWRNNWFERYNLPPASNQTFLLGILSRCREWIDYSKHLKSMPRVASL